MDNFIPIPLMEELGYCRPYCLRMIGSQLFIFSGYGQVFPAESLQKDAHQAMRTHVCLYVCICLRTHVCLCACMLLCVYGRGCSSRTKIT